jgi:UDP-N-acetylglucosamine 2-epimerase (non-hydrolysing)
MEKIKALLVFGTRPEAVKMAPLYKELVKHSEFDAKVCVTAQHRQMLDQVLEIFDITPEYDLDIMKASQSLAYITTSVLEGIDGVLKSDKPDIVLVHGDTTTTFAAALAAFYSRVAIGHIEAGLRTYDKYSPYPEEMNRCLTGVMTDMHFTPTNLTYNNLLRENVPQDRIYITGNTVIDALKTTARDDWQSEIKDWAADSRLILLTSHRRENLGDTMKGFFRAVNRIVEEFEDVKVVYPVHLNPIVQNAADEVLKGNDRIRLIAPMEVLDFHNLMKCAYLVLTDSGGIQEEAPSFGVPVIVMRDTTERPEGVEAGTLKLAGTNEDVIHDLTYELLTDKELYLKMSNTANPYGDGKASERIADAIIAKYKK